MKTWTVGTLTRYIQELLEADPQLGDVWLSGELSNVSHSSAGHLYFTLKDATAAIRCVMWRSAVEQVTWAPAQGTAALAHGRISVYSVQGNYQLVVDQLQPIGLGDLYNQFERLREQLKAEGLFDDARKRLLPAFPKLLGIVTSPQAAALRDVLNVIGRRYPLVRIRLAPTLVQGTTAPPQIVAALQAVDADDEVDAILLVRGGGSLEELWAFNDEQVARAIAACRHPVVCGVGHETDFTIADFVADVRAPTPSAAAELAVPDQAELRQRVGLRARQIEQALRRRLSLARQATDQQRRALQRLSPQTQIEARRQQVDDLSQRAGRSLGHALALYHSQLAGLQARLAALSPLAVLERGYAIVRQQDTGAIVRQVEQVAPGDRLSVRVQDGEFGATVRSGS
jgi:exodeoxyribonuclease VII large subunit